MITTMMMTQRGVVVGYKCIKTLVRGKCATYDDDNDNDMEMTLSLVAAMCVYVVY